MAHKIELPHDMVLSTQSAEWHGLATVVPVINAESVKPLLFPIVESPAFIEVDGIKSTLDNYKVLVADHRNCRPDLVASGDDLMVPLHIPKAGYRVISNLEVWNTMESSLRDLGCKVTSVCTLERGKKFSISADIGNSDLVINKDKFKANLNFVTSHDGSIAMETFDSMIRIVCMNTFQASRNAAGDTGFKVYHTKNADLAMSGLSDLINGILKGRVETAEVLEYLATCKVDSNDALAMASGYFCEVTDSVKLSSRAMNAASEIVNLFANGIGNAGRSLYDLANGATEYWTSGQGTGIKGASTASRVYRSEFGQAAKHKADFITMLSDENHRSKCLEVGRDAVALSLKS